MDALRQDLVQALRSLRRNRGLTLAVLLTLAFGIGANVALFSVGYGVLLRPLPYPEPDRLVRISERHAGALSPIPFALLSNLTRDAWLPRARTLEGLALWNRETYTLTEAGGPVRLKGASVSPSLFGLLRATPQLGRSFLAEEATPGRSDVVMLSARLWRERFGGEPSVVGKTLTLDGRPHVVVGVASADFSFPDPDVLLWTPYAPSPEGPDSMDVFAAVGRLKPTVSPAQAEAEGTAAARSVTRPFLADLFFGKGGPVEVQVRPIVEEMTARVRPALLVLATGVGLVLLVACANVAALTLSRGVERERELAVRTALGAGRGRLARQLLTESLLVALLGGAVGLGLAWGAIHVLPALAPEGLPRIENVRIDVGVMAFALAVSLLAGLLAGVLPALRGARTGLSPVLHDGGSRATGRRAGRIGQGLLVAEAALAVVLLVGAGLLVRSFSELVKVDAGYDPTGVLMAQVCFPQDMPAERRRQSIDELLSRLQGTPGVVAAATGNMPPFARAVAVAGAPLPWRGKGGEPVTARVLYHSVSPGYGETLHLRLREGRWLEASDTGQPVRAMLVNQEFVRAYVRDGRSVVGRRLEGFMSDDKTTTEIVGVVGNVLKDGLDAKPQPEVYVADASEVPAEVSLVVRTEGDPLAVAPSAHRSRPPDRPHGRHRWNHDALGAGIVVGCGAALRGHRADRLRGSRPRARGDGSLRRALLQRLPEAARDRNTRGSRGAPSGSAGPRPAPGPHLDPGRARPGPPGRCLRRTPPRRASLRHHAQRRRRVRDSARVAPAGRHRGLPHPSPTRGERRSRPGPAERVRASRRQWTERFLP